MEDELRKNQEPNEGQEQHSHEEREPALPEGRADGRRGETARQLIRRATQGRPRSVCRTVRPLAVRSCFSIGEEARPEQAIHSDTSLPVCWVTL
jgi:hypothetical protein